MEEIKRVAEMWWCGDDDCDCHQPRIVEFRTDWRGWRRDFRVIEEGPFHSYPDAEEWEEMRQWLHDACARHGVEYPEDDA